MEQKDRKRKRQSKQGAKHHKWEREKETDTANKESETDMKGGKTKWNGCELLRRDTDRQIA